MPVNKLGRSTTDRKKKVTRTGVTMSTIRRDGGNTIIGDLNVTGNKITNVGDPASNQDVATKGYVHSTSVSKSGDTMTGDLLLTTGLDETRLLGCTDLDTGKAFSIALGSPQNFIGYTPDSPLETQSPVAIETTKGLAVKINNSNVIQCGQRINVNNDISMSDFRIKHLPDSISRQEPATKNNVDERKPLITVWAEASGEISGEEYKLSFGSGFEGRGRRRSGYTMMAQGRILKMGMAASSIGNPVSGIAEQISS